MSKKELEKTEEKNLIQPIGQQRIPSTNNIQRRHLEGLTKEANAKNVSRIALIDEAFDDYLRKTNDTGDIDQMDAETRNYWTGRDLAIVKGKLLEKCKTMNPYKKAYLFRKLKDATDRKRTFEALGLPKDLEELNFIAGILEKAVSNRNGDGTIANYSLLQISNEIRIELSQIQIEFLELALGQKSVEAIRERAKGKFPELKIEEEETDSTKKQNYEPVKKDKLDVAKKLTSGIAESSELVPLFDQ